MKNINWIVRIKHKAFWVALIPAVILLITQAAGIFGITLDLSDLQGKLVDIVGTVFVVLAILGIVVDPTTEGLSDSTQALTYTEPKTDNTVSVQTRQPLDIQTTESTDTTETEAE